MTPLAPIARRPWLVPVVGDDGRPLSATENREAWLAARVSGLGGSEIAAIVGEHPDKKAIDVWLDHTTGDRIDLAGDRADVGNLLEPVILSWYAVGTPKWPRVGGSLRVVKPPTVYHRDRPWHRGSADGLAFYPETIAPHATDDDAVLRTGAEPDHGVEVKTHGWFAGRNYETADDGVPIEVPNDKRIQCVWYQALWEVDRWRLVALVDTHLRKTYEIHRDRELEAYLLEEADRFWRVNVLGGVPPDPDGSDSFGKYIAGRFQKHRAELLPSSPEIDAAARKLRRVCRAAKHVEREQDRLEQVIKLYIGDAAGVQTAEGTITYKYRASGKFKDKDLRASLYKRCGMTDAEIAELEAQYVQPGFRAIHKPRWT